MEQLSIPLSRITLGTNVRKADEKPDEALQRNIEAVGLLQPLIVREIKDGYELVAGFRRHLAMTTSLRFKKTDKVACMVVDEAAQGTAIALAENALRKAMTPMEEYRAYVAMIEDKMAPADIAFAFNITERQVQRRLSLGNLIPEIQEIIEGGNKADPDGDYNEDDMDDDYYDDVIPVDAVQILAQLTPEKQAKWLKEYTAEGANKWSLNLPTKIRSLYIGSHFRIENALFPLDEYKGEIAGDLFAKEDGGGILVDVEEASKLQEAAILKALKPYADAGADVEPQSGRYDYRYTRIEIDELGGLDPAERKNLSILYDIDEEGEVLVSYKRKEKDEKKTKSDQPAKKASINAAATGIFCDQRYDQIRNRINETVGDRVANMIVEALWGHSGYSDHLTANCDQETREKHQATTQELTFEALKDLPADELLAIIADITSGHIPDNPQMLARHYGLRIHEHYRPDAALLAKQPKAILEGWAKDMKCSAVTLKAFAKLKRTDMAADLVKLMERNPEWVPAELRWSWETEDQAEDKKEAA